MVNGNGAGAGIAGPEIRRDMTLLDILKLIDRDYFPPTLEKDKSGHESIDSRPDSVFKVAICFMCEEETWITTYPENEILIPWYDCEVTAISPSSEKYTLEIWLKDIKYLKEKFPHCLYVEEEGEE